MPAPGRRRPPPPGPPQANGGEVTREAMDRFLQESAELQGLDDASYRLLRGVRWLAGLCVGLAAAGCAGESATTSAP
ncbi:hypothetical protein ACF07Y_13640 [Streptomyces sp. NPDC016566]|uniref:hypothetical protein n=1 Tax=Streptomyces sp. NPDC016566 TaxID=3364967 RepID=UPI0036F9A37F